MWYERWPIKTEVSWLTPNSRCDVRSSDISAPVPHCRTTLLIRGVHTGRALNKMLLLLYSSVALLKTRHQIIYKEETRLVNNILYVYTNCLVSKYN